MRLIIDGNDVRGDIVRLIRMRAETASNAARFAQTQRERAGLTRTAAELSEVASMIESATIETGEPCA